MNIKPNILYSGAKIKNATTIIIFCDENGKISKNIKEYKIENDLEYAINIEKFKGKFGKSVSVLLGENEIGIDKAIVVGLGKINEIKEHDWAKLGGHIMAQSVVGEEIAVLANTPNGKSIEANKMNEIAIGMKLAAYRFTKHKTKNKKDKKEVRYTFYSDSARTSSIRWSSVGMHIADGVGVARNLVNEPANVLTPKQFVAEAQKLKKIGAKVEVLGKAEMKKLKMNALLGVAQGSRNDPYMVIIKWSGAKKTNKQPIAFVGKGVTFDTGGISIKPSGGMEHMKGDMAGAAAVTGLMHTLAARKAKVNVIGILALVENMPDGNAQRPGDIVTSMSGQTIEVLNTDAEGRLVLADAFTYCQQKYKPKCMINLATLTGAIVVALGHHHAGMFSNNDKLAQKLHKAGQKTNEKVWRMPLGKEYDKLMDSKIADMRNIGGGRYGGSITAAQFLQRFVNENVEWAHLDVAGTAIESPQSIINKSWGSGFGVRLLNELVCDSYE